MSVALTKYEACEIVANRALLLSGGSDILLSKEEMPKNKDFFVIAKRELLLGKLDVIVLRDKEEYHVSTMQLPDNIVNTFSD